MTRLPSVKGADVVGALKREGFAVQRIKGSHHIMKHSDGRKTVVPVHSGHDIKRGLLRKIIEDAGMSVDDFTALL